MRRERGLGNADSLQALVSGDQALTLKVLSDRSIRMTAPHGFGESISRDFGKHPFRRGDQVRAGQFVATVKDVTPHGKPMVVDFEFKHPLQSSNLRIFEWRDTGYAPWALPAVGQTVTLSAIHAGALAAKRLKALL